MSEQQRMGSYTVDFTNENNDQVSVFFVVALNSEMAMIKASALLSDKHEWWATGVDRVTDAK